jgi:hypothetical protein
MNKVAQPVSRTLLVRQSVANVWCWCGNAAADTVVGEWRHKAGREWHSATGEHAQRATDLDHAVALLALHLRT